MSESLLEQCHLSGNIFDDDLLYLRTVKQGLSGSRVRLLVDSGLSTNKDISVVFDVTKPNLHRLFKKKLLTDNQTEVFLDYLHVFVKAEEVFEDKETAKEWLDERIPALNDERPRNLLSTYKGRELVMKTLDSIEHGEFT